jgi:hypothetical protein
MRVSSIALVVVIMCCASTLQAFSPVPLSRPTFVALTAVAYGEIDHSHDTKESRVVRLGQRIKRTVKAVKRNAAVVALATLAFRQPCPVGATVVADSTEDVDFQREMTTNVIPVATTVVAAGGAGAVVANYIIKRGEKGESVDEPGSKQIEEITPPVEATLSTSEVTDDMETKRKDKNRIANLLEQVKDAEKRVLAATVGENIPLSIPIVSGRDLKSKPVQVVGESGYTTEERLKIINNVFECHGFFPDLRSEDELPAEIQLMRQQPKSKSALAAIKLRYAAIPDESERVYTMLVDLGMMESYDHLEEYSDNFDDSDL